MLISIMISAGVGLLVALYFYVTETRMKNNPNYRSVCDISDHISCSKSLKSGYVSPVGAALFYMLVGCLGYFDLVTPLLIITSIGGLGTCVAAYLIYFRVKTFCLPCTAIFITNFVLLYQVILIVR